MVGPAALPVRPVAYEEKDGQFRIATDTDALARALLGHCDTADPAYRKAARALLDCVGGQCAAEDARAACIAALTGAGVFVRGER